MRKKKHNKIMKVPLHPKPKKINFTGNLSHYTVHKKLKSPKYTLNEVVCFFF